MPPRSKDEIGSLEEVRSRLYRGDPTPAERTELPSVEGPELPHAWQELPPLATLKQRTVPHIRIAGLFFGGAVLFFLIALAFAGYFFYFGGNSVSVDKISIDIQGPTTIAGGDTVPLSLSITNRNPVAIDNATVEVDFPSGTLAADGSLAPYPRYTENFGTIASGATVLRSIKAIVFGGAGDTVVLPLHFSYSTTGSNAVFTKPSSYSVAISSTPLSVSVETLAETVSGKPLVLTLTARSNATVPLENVVLAAVLPFGFTVTNSSVPLNSGSIYLGTMQPGASRTVTISGTLAGQDGEQRVFHFTVGTAKSVNDQSVAVAYMTQDASVAIAAPFITTGLTINGEKGDNVVVTPGKTQTVTVSYTNTLSTSLNDATVAIAISGSAVDYGSIETTSGFYRSSDHTVVFSKDTDSSLATLAPGASGIGSFTFATLPMSSSVSSPSITFTTSVSGTRVGQTNVPENVSATMSKTIKVATAMRLTAFSLHTSGPISNTGAFPPTANQATTYTIALNASDDGNAVAGGSVSLTLPSYVTYTNRTAGLGTFSYDDKSRMVSWNTGDFTQGSSKQGYFQVSFTPSSSQKGSSPTLTGPISFSGFDRFASVAVKASADPVTTETKGDPGYNPSTAIVQ